MKEKILCMVDKFFPDSSANTICCKHVMDYLKSKGYHVDVLSIKQSAFDKSCEEYENSRVIKLECYQSKFLKAFRKFTKGKKWWELPGLVRKAVGSLQLIKTVFKPKAGYVTLDSLSYKNIYKQISKIEKNYDILISFSMPFSWNIIAYEMLRRGVAKRWYAVLLDAFVFNKTLNPMGLKYRKKLENKFLTNANYVFVADGAIEENLKQKYIPDYSDKLLQIHLPVLKEYKINHLNKTTEDITLLYTGHFYKDIRNPEKMLDILSELEKNNKIRIFGDGCEHTLNQKKKKFKYDNLLIGGRISHKQCLEEIEDADILINLGNTVTNQMPSKIFEYISYGKPIINFYFTDEDLCLKVFDKYPLVYSINLNNYTLHQVEELKEFIGKYKHTKLTYEEATRNLSEYRVENIVEKIYLKIKEEEKTR